MFKKRDSLGSNSPGNTTPKKLGKIMTATENFLNKNRPAQSQGSDVDITESGQTMAPGVRRKVVFKKTKGSKLRQQNAERYKGYEERMEKRR